MPTAFTSSTVYANNPSVTVTAGGTTASSGDNSLTVSSSAAFPAASSTAVPKTYFKIADPVQPTEIMTVTNVSGTTWTVTRGAEGSSITTHAASWTAYQVITAGDMLSMQQASGAIVTPVTLNASTTETVMNYYQPMNNEIVAGTGYRLLANGTIATASTVPTLQWKLYWGATGASGAAVSGGTGLTSIITGTKCPALVASIASGSFFTVEAHVIFLSTTSVLSTINVFWQNTTTTYSGVAAAGAGTTISGTGPISMTAKWSAATSGNALTVAGIATSRIC